MDVTGLHRMEAERQVISEVVHALNQTANLDQLLEGIHQALKKVLYAENCFVAPVCTLALMGEIVIETGGGSVFEE